MEARKIHLQFDIEPEMVLELPHNVAQLTKLPFSVYLRTDDRLSISKMYHHKCNTPLFIHISHYLVRPQITIHKMNRSYLFTTLIFGILMLQFVGQCTSKKEESAAITKPNIVIIYADDIALYRCAQLFGDLLAQSICVAHRHLPLATAARYRRSIRPAILQRFRCDLTADIKRKRIYDCLHRQVAPGVELEL